MTQSFPLVTVYIPCRNYAPFLPSAVQSVIDQLYKNWEMLILDEGSDDDTFVIAKGFQRQCPERISVIHNSKPVGLQKIANNVLRIANGKYVMRLDADDWLDEGALLLMVAKLESKAEYGLVHSNYYYTDEQGKILGTERRQKIGNEEASRHLPPHGACTMVRTRELKAVGGYSEDVNAQDGWDLWFKLLYRVKCAHLDAPLFYYRQHGESLSRDSNRLLKARAEIFRNSRERLEGSYNLTCLAIIPVRESYPEWKGVPYQRIKGKTLLERALESAATANGVTEIAISSENQSVLDFSEELENQTGYKHERILRLQSASRSSLKPLEILTQAVEVFHKKHNYIPDIILFLSIHAPLRKAEHVDKAIDVLRVNMSDSVVSVQQEWEPMFCHGKKGLELLNPGRFDGLEFEKESLYRFNGAIIGLWSCNLQENTLFGDSIAYIEMSESDSLQVKHESDIANYFQ